MDRDGFREERGYRVDHAEAGAQDRDKADVARGGGLEGVGVS
jgi:hypothetical protein